MQLPAGLVKIVIGVSLLAGLCLPAYAGIEDTLSYYDSDDFGNDIYFGSGPSGDYEFIFVDGSASAGTYASASILSIYKSKQAGYAVIPANDFNEMNRNRQFAKNYTVDCTRQRLTIDGGTVVRLSELNAFHQTSAGMACSVLDMD